MQDSLGIFLFYYIRHQLKFLTILKKWEHTSFRVARQRKKKLAWIGWEKILSKQENGGLSISSLKAQNIALLVKWWWHFKEHKHELWKRVIIAIYGQDGGFIVPSRVKWKSYCWGNIANLLATLAKENIDLKELFTESQPNQRSNWAWKLEPWGIYSFSSLHMLIDNFSLPKSSIV